MSSNWLGGNNKWNVVNQASEMALTVRHLGQFSETGPKTSPNVE